MFHLLFIIASYGALLILLMPETGTGILVTAGVLAIGICLIIFKKVHKVTFGKDKQLFLIPAAILLATDFGLNFYYRWIPSSKLQAIAAMFHIPTEGMLLIGSLILSGLSVYVLYAALQIILKKFSNVNPQNHLVIDLLSCIIASVITVMLAQDMIDSAFFFMGFSNFMWGVLIVSVVILFFYCLIGRIIPSIFFGAGIFMVISTINVYVFQFRGHLFEPIDIFSAGTAMNVLDKYDLLPIPLGILTGWGVFAAVLIVLHCLQSKSTSKPGAKSRCILMAVCVIGTVSIAGYTTKLPSYHWSNEGARFHGYILDFVSKLREISSPEPENYSIERVSNLVDQYTADTSEAESELSEHPHIIVIMDEAFSDLRVLGEFSTNTEVMPFLSSLKENTISGYALASVYGGNTANSEYEFLTGNSMAWLSPNAVPYQQYTRSLTSSMVSYLKSSHHYKCVAMHPYYASGWNRPSAYEYLGFDACYFLEDFPQKRFVRDLVSDLEMFQFLIETFEEQKENPLFLFGVTVQNHGGYGYHGENYTQHISLNHYEGAYPEVEQYLSLIHETDKAVEYLITYFQDIEEDVVIVFFGDHQPSIRESFYKTVSGITADTLDEQQKRYQVPFFIWANYDIDEQYIDCISLNYLSSYVYDAAGIALPPYNQFLSDMEEIIPSINAYGFYSLSAGHYLPFDAAVEEEQRWLELYEVLQYNNIFDLKHRNETLFPAWK